MAKKKTSHSSTKSSRAELGTAVETTRNIPIKHVIPAGTHSFFCNHVIVQNESPFFHLSFFRLEQPIIMTESPEKAQKIFGEMDEIEARCISRVTLPEHLLLNLIDTLKRNHERSNG